MAGYYIRKSHGSKRWIVFLEGGWYCFDHHSCRNRWHRMKGLMSSKMWPETRNVGGILSPDPQENPHWWNATHVAGGTGVLLNVDRVADYLKSVGSGVQVRGLSDSGWFLDNEPFAPMECTDSHSCAPVDSIKQGFRLWNGQVPEKCGQQQNPTEMWKCYFGYRLYPTLRTPLFVFQWLFDEAQLTADNVGAPMTKAQWDYIHEVGDHLRQTLHNVTAVFAPSCISHVILTKRDWRFVQVNQMSLPEALNCWEHDTVDTRDNHVHHRYHHRHIHSETYMLSDSPEDYRYHHYGSRSTAAPAMSHSPPTTTATLWSDSNETILIPEAAHNGSRTKNKRKQRRKGKKKQKKRHKKGRKNRPERSYLFGEVKDDWDESINPPTTCHLKLLDECTWPQCNRACPKLLNPFTGEEMDFIELLKSFGLDMSSVAMALGLDLDALNAMGNDQLLQILTQHSRK